VALVKDSGGIVRACLSKDPKAFKTDRQVGFLLRRAYQMFYANLSGRISEFGITPQQLSALCKIYEIGKISQNRLGRLVAMDPAAIHGVIRRLTERDLIVQSRDPSDQRLLLLSLSEKGRQMVEQMIPLALQSQAHSLGRLSPAETEQFVALLARLAGEIED
jgi:DNA-binding MarR family transcriptional regulator